MKKLLSFFITFVLAMSMAMTAIAQVTSYVGYCDRQIATVTSGKYTGMGSSNGTVNIAIRLSKAQLAAYKGCVLVGVNYGMPTSQGLSCLNAWVRTSRDGADLTTGSTISTSYGWREISVKPYTITGEERELWIGASYVNTSKVFVAVSFAGTTKYDGCWVDNGTGWANYASQGWGSLSLEAIFSNVFESNGIYYYLDHASQTAIVTDHGLHFSYEGVVSIPSYVTTNDGKRYDVVAINDEAFSGCSDLTSVTIPNSVTSIGKKAFRGCSGLTSVSIPNSVTTIGNSAFSGCTGLTSVTIPNSVTSIGEYAFNGCSGLTSVTIPNSVTSIGEFAFYNCTSLPVIDNIQYADTYLVGVVNINQSAYKIKDGTRFIGTGAFSGFSSLTSITIPNSVTSIGSAAFSGCTGLTSITIPNSVTSIERYAFEGCKSLTSVTISNSVTSIGTYAFSGCKSLTSVIIPNSVTSIGQYAFSGCTGLTSVTIPNSVTSIGQYAFSGCTGLTSVTIPNSVTSIGYAAFSSCTGLTSVTIPNSVTSIGNSAFYNCSNLRDIYSLNLTPPTCGSNTFNDVKTVNCRLHVPIGTREDYAFADGWCDFYNILDDIEVAPDLVGDINGDGNVNVQDYVGIAKYILQGDFDDFVFDAGDTNKDGTINVQDYMAVAKIILGEGANSAHRAAAVAVDMTNDHLDGEMTADGNIRVALDNAAQYVMFQLDVTLPEGAALVGVEGTDRMKSSHTIEWCKQEGNVWRILVGTTSLATFRGNAGDLLTLEVNGMDEGFATIENCLFVTPENTLKRMADLTIGAVTGISGVTSSEEATIYNLQGQRVANSKTLPSGVYISNGKKIVVKKQ